MKKLLVALAALMIAAPLGGCTDPEDSSRRALLGLGMTDVNVHGRELFAGFNCAESDGWARNFDAKGFTGQPVTGTVCGAYLGKGTTVRFD